MRTSQHWLSRLLECTQSLCQHQNSWKGWGWVGGALRDGGWEWGRGGESGRGGFARTVVGAPSEWCRLQELCCATGARKPRFDWMLPYATD